MPEWSADLCSVDSDLLSNNENSEKIEFSAYLANMNVNCMFVHRIFVMTFFMTSLEEREISHADMGSALCV